ncbi:hypothetical protein ABZ372_31990 [Streptomyces sp. NPDC005921]
MIRPRGPRTTHPAPETDRVADMVERHDRDRAEPVRSVHRPNAPPGMARVATGTMARRVNAQEAQDFGICTERACPASSEDHGAACGMV